MALKTIIDNIQNARAKLDAELKVAGEQGKALIAQELAKNLPPGTAIQWTQYTDYFNDGSPCTFSVHEPQLVRFDGRTGGHDDADGDEVTLNLSTAIERYGKPDEQREYTRNDYGARRTPEQIKNHTYPQVVEKYTVHGVPEIDGVTVEQLEKLAGTFASIPESVMEAAFGDHTRVRVTSSGEAEVSDYSDHD